MEKPARAAEFNKRHAEFIKLQRDSMVGGNRPSNIQFDLLAAVRILKLVRSVAWPDGTLVMISDNMKIFKALSQPNPKIQTWSN
jgi:hypothetical protein